MGGKRRWPGTAFQADRRSGETKPYLDGIETNIGCRVIRHRPETNGIARLLEAETGLLHTKREGGTRDASARAFHSFRVTGPGWHNAAKRDRGS